jgi:hypothetical protein
MHIVPLLLGLAGLYDHVAADLRRGEPLVIEAHVALCDNSIIKCGSKTLGDGDSLATNLYWATDGGLRGWFERRGSGWTRVAVVPGASPAVLETRVYRRRVTPGGEWRARGVDQPFEVYVVAHAWRGKRIDDALDTFVADLHAAAPRPLTVDGRTLRAGPAAHVVAFIGHDRFMDRDQVSFPKTSSSQPKGMIMVSCASASYLRAISGDTRVPLLLTADLLFAGSHAFDGAIRAFADGGSFAAIRQAAAQAYADGERKPVGRVLTLFTNPGDSRWLRH